MDNRQNALYQKDNLRISACCRYCASRGKTIGKTIECLVHRVDVNNSLVCNSFVETTDPAVIRLAKAGFPVEEDWYA
jgi:hypothetical protein